MPAVDGADGSIGPGRFHNVGAPARRGDPLSGRPGTDDGRLSLRIPRTLGRWGEGHSTTELNHFDPPHPGLLPEGEGAPHLDSTALELALLPDISLVPNQSAITASRADSLCARKHLAMRIAAQIACDLPNVHFFNTLPDHHEANAQKRTTNAHLQQS